MPALNHAQRDHQRGRIDDADLRFVEDATRRIVEELDAPEEPAEPPAAYGPVVLGLPARNEADEVALLMLKQPLDPGRLAMEVASPDLLASEIVALVEEREPAAVLIGALAGAGHSHAPPLPLQAPARAIPGPADRASAGGEPRRSAAARDGDAGRRGRSGGRHALAEADAQLQELASA